MLRADASPAMGTGHVMRCLALALAWRERGGEAILMGSVEGRALRERVAECGVRLEPTGPGSSGPDDPGRLAALATRRRSRWVVLDGYAFPVGYDAALRRAGLRVLEIDDFAHLPRYDADLVLNQNLGAERFAYRTAPDTRLLTGPGYALLRPEFRRMRECCVDGDGTNRTCRTHPYAPQGPIRLLVTLGGSDPGGATLAVIRAIALLCDPHLQSRVVVGPSNSRGEEIRAAAAAAPGVEILESVREMPALMAWADLAVAAGGTTSWELACLGLPAVVLVLADNQAAIARELDAAGISRNLGPAAGCSPERIAGAIREMLDDPERLRSMSARAAALVDGRGAGRVLDAMGLTAEVGR